MENTQVQDNILGTEKITRLLLKFSIPGIVSMLVNAIYNLVDQIFIGQGVGYLGNGATNVVFPFVQLMLAVSLLVAAGTAASAGLNLGKQDQREANHYVGTGLCMALIAGLTVFALGEIFMVPFLNLFGATEANLPYAITYGRIILIGFPFVSCGILTSDIIRMDGNPRYSMLSMLLGAIINIICDPLFIFIFKWGVAGAALATILGQIASLVMNIFKFRRMNTLAFSVADMKLSFKRVSRIVAIGTSAFLTQISGMISTIILNNQAAKYGAMSVYGADIPVTCFGIIMKVNAIMMSCILGISTSTQPIFSFNFGAEKYARVRELILKTAVATFLIGIVGWFFFQFYPQQIVSIFGQESDLYNEFACMCLKNMTMLIFVMGIPMMAGTYFQSIGKPTQAVILSLSRQLLFSIPLILILPIFMGVVGIMYSYPISDVFSIILSTTLLAKEMKKLKEMEKKVA